MAKDGKFVALAVAQRKFLAAISTLERYPMPAELLQVQREMLNTKDWRQRPRSVVQLWEGAKTVKKQIYQVVARPLVERASTCSKRGARAPKVCEAARLHPEVPHTRIADREPSLYPELLRQLGMAIFSESKKQSISLN